MENVNNEKNILVIYKNPGKFYNVVGIDAYILNYFFGYKVINDKRAGFPENVIDKVLEKLEDEKISYQVIYTDKNPLIKDYKKINRYNKIVKLVQEQMELNKRIELIINKIKSCEKNQLLEIVDRIERCII